MTYECQYLKQFGDEKVMWERLSVAWLVVVDDNQDDREAAAGSAGDLLDDSCLLLLLHLGRSQPLLDRCSHRRTGLSSSSSLIIISTRSSSVLDTSSSRTLLSLQLSTFLQMIQNRKEKIAYLKNFFSENFYEIMQQDYILNDGESGSVFAGVMPPWLRCFVTKLHKNTKNYFWPLNIFLFQLTLTSVRVSWAGLLERSDCADSMIVKWFKGDNTNDFSMSDPLTVETNSFIVKDVVPRQLYTYQVSRHISFS